MNAISLASKLGKNILINTLLDFWQRGLTIVSPVNLQYLADRWAITTSGTTGLVTVSRSTNVPENSIANYSMRVQVTTADATVGASDQVGIQQTIEGNFARRVYNKRSRIGFYVRSNKLGPLSVSLANQPVTRSFVTSFEITNADVWKFVEIPVAKIDTLIGSWAKDTSAGIRFMLKLMEGRAANTTANNSLWENGNFQALPGQTNFMDTVGNYLEITELQFVEGNGLYESSEIVRDYADELKLCQRYYEKSYSLNVAPGTVVSNGQSDKSGVVIGGNLICGTDTYATLKRDTPIIVTYNPGTGTQGTVVTQAAGGAIAERVATLNTSNERGFAFYVGTTDVRAQYQWTSNAEL